MIGGRAIGRDVHFYNFAEPDKALGGLILNSSYRVTLRSTGHDLTPTDEPLQPGHYDIRSYSHKDTICITDEPCIIRIISQSSTDRDATFRMQVRERDGKCVITGRDNWSTFHAAHIFPLSSEGYFVQSGFSRWITNRIGERDTGINSCQNRLLMRSHMHEQFDGFYFSINPDEGYKITCFNEDFDGIDGRILDPRDELLRWHFRQAVLANMRGAGEPSFETEFPPGTDMMGEILSGSTAAKRMEAELFSRLGSYDIAWDSQKPIGQS
ncbi:HNH endonuclease-domain-containing protein [Lipomyces starkeyi]